MMLISRGRDRGLRRSQGWRGDRPAVRRCRWPKPQRRLHQPSIPQPSNQLAVLREVATTVDQNRLKGKAK